MRTIALVTQKGGCGKTTLTSNLAVAAEIEGQRALIIDSDPQGTAVEWWQDRDDTTIECVSVSGDEISKAIDIAKQRGFDIVIIDTPARAEPVNAAAIRAADFSLVPCRPTLPDMRAQGETAGVIKRLSKAGALVLTQTPARGSRSLETKRGLAVYGLPVAAQEITNLVAYQDAYSLGQGVLEYEPDGRAAKEIRKLWTWMHKKMEQLL